MKTPTSSEYALIDNKPIDQLKVTELKDELKRRRLKTGGLKDELIRRLDEALRSEMDETSVEGNNDDGIEEPETENVVTDAPDNVVMVEQPVVAAGDAGMVASGYDEVTMGYAEKVVVEAKEVVVNDDANVCSVETDYKDNQEQLAKDESCKEQQSGLGNNHAFEEGGIAGTDLASEAVSDDASKQQLDSGNGLVSMEVTVTTTKEVSVVVGSEFSKEQSGLVDDPVSGEGIVGTTDGASVVMGDKVTDDFPSEKAAGGNGLVDDHIERDNVSSGEQEHSEDVTPAHDDVKLVSSVQNNQVSEVSTSLGFPVKSNISVSTDSLSFVEKTDLKDNLIADNVKLESDVTPEMVQPSSSDLVPDGGESHLRDVDKPHENKVSVQETDNSVANVDMGQKNYSSELGSEKLNIDRSSGDDSMEEDGLETKPIDSNYNSEDVGQKTEKNEVTIIKAESPLAIAMDTDLCAESKIIPDQKNDVATFSEKRKLSDEEPVLNKPAKRQHRWKTESNTVTEPQTSHNPPPASSLDVPQSAALKRSISKSDSFGAIDLPKEREVPPSTKPATNSLRIDRFLRPFTLKAVQELLAKTGSVASFWMDHIKTHCYVTYSSVEEAVETRNAVYNLQWPPNGGRQLMAEFVEPEEVKLRLEPPSATQAPLTNSAPSKVPEPSKIPQPSPRQLSVRQRLAPQPGPLPPPPPPIINPVPVRGWLPPPPPPIEKVITPIVTLDDLFRKTKAIPRIYYLPLTDEEVAEKRSKSKQ